MFGFGSSEGDSVFMNSSHHPYTSSIASSASSSSSSVFSVDCASSQTSVSSASSSSLHVVWGPEDTTSYVPSTNDPPGHATSSSNEKITKVASSSAVPAPNDIDSAVVPDLRQNPRRTKPAAQQHARRGNPTTACPRPIPSLVRQCDRKVNFVDNLVGKLF